MICHMEQPTRLSSEGYRRAYIDAHHSLSYGTVVNVMVSLQKAKVTKPKKVKSASKAVKPKAAKPKVAKAKKVAAKKK